MREESSKTEVTEIFRWPRQQIRRAYRWMVSYADSKGAKSALAAFAFAESSFFPIPPDPLLIAMTAGKPRSYLRFAAICTLASISGGILGYIIGAGLFEAIGRQIIETYHLQDEFAVFGQRYQANAFLAVFTAAFTPIPYKLITISAGVFKVNFWHFIIASTVGRGIRFYLVAALAHFFGRKYQEQITKYIDILSVIFVIVLILGFVVIKYI